MQGCSICHNLIKEKHRHRMHLEFTPQQLQQSAVERKCQWCLALLRSIMLMEDSDWSLINDVRIIYGSGPEADWGSVQAAERIILELYFHRGGPRMNLEVFCSRSNEGIFMSRGQAIRPATRLGQYDPMSQKALRWVESMLNDCLDDHLCPTALENPFPARILALSTTSEGGFAVQLVDGKKASGRYAALSHCWGSQLTCTTTSGNLAARFKGIPWTELPRTFRDAVRYCLELKISYLWIDALCIIQDDRKDWQTYSARMADIYQNAFITLAATSAANSSVGCFPRQALARREKSMEFTPTPGNTYQIQIRRELSHLWDHSSAYTKQDNPLLLRGWAFQERILSPRVLHFCKQELVWECGQGTVCECGSMPEVPNIKEDFTFVARPPNGHDGFTPGHNAGSRSSADLEQLTYGTDTEVHTTQQRLEGLGLGERINISASSQWQEIVQQYSALELSKQSDRLPAISGIAERMAPFLGEYLAGLWSPSIMMDLLWRVDDCRTVMEPPREYIGPSWSWISVNSKVSFIGMRPRTDSPYRSRIINTGAKSIAEPYQPARLEGGKVKVTGENPYGEASSAFLVVTGEMKEVTIQGSMVSSEWNAGEGAGMSSMELPFWLDYDFLGGPQHVPAVLFMIIPRVFLVLKLVSGAFQEGRPDSECEFKRVGLLEVPDGMEESFQFDLMSGSKRQTLILV